jgi:hypothetical protein
MSATLPTAITYSIDPFHEFPTRGGPELGGEPPFVRCTRHHCPNL